MFIDSTRNYRKGIFTLISLFLFVNVEFACTAIIREPQYTVCDAATCVEISIDILNSIDTSFDPCDDFYNYVCDGWMKTYPFDGYDRFSDWDETVSWRTADIMKAPIRPTDTEAMKKVKGIFQMCMSRLDSSGVTDLKQFLDRLGGWPILIPPRAPRNNRRMSWQVISTYLDRYSVSGAFYRIGMGWQFEDFTKIIMIVPPSDTDRDLTYMRRVVYSMLTDDPRLNEEEFVRAVDQDVGDVKKFAEQLTKITNSPGIDTLSITKWQEKYDKQNYRPDMAITQINWLHVIQRAYPVYSINASEEITVSGVTYFKDLTKLLSETSERTIVNYVLWTFVRPLLRYISEDIRSIVRFPTDISKRELECIDELNLKHAIWYEYMKVHSSNASRASIRMDINNVKNALRQQIRNAKWMDQKTRDGADKLLSSVRMQIGGPEWYSDSNIDEYYKDLAVSHSYFYTALNILFFDLYEERRQLRTPLNITETDNFDWYIISPMNVNAVYHRSFNTITIPVALADDFMYHMERPPALNYGMLGSVAAHELSHAYDAERKLYERGGYNRVWTNDSVKAYQEKVKCLVEQYNNYEIPEANNASIKVNGSLTLNENIADSGVLAAFRAYKKYVHDQDHVERRLVNLEQYTADQLFFIGYANMHCRYISSEAAKAEIKSSHAPWPVRLHGSISNMDEFGAAFNCPLGSRLNPVKKCKIWD